MYTTRTHSRLWILGLVVLAIAAAGANWFLHFHRGDLGLKAHEAANAPYAAEDRVVCFGHVDVEYGVRSLYPLQPGRVTDVLVHEGDRVPEEAVLLKVDDTQSKILVRKAQADLKAAEAILVQAKKAPEQQIAKMAQQKAMIEGLKNSLSAERHGLSRKEQLLKEQQINSQEVLAAADLVKAREAALHAAQEQLVELELNDPEVTVSRAQADVAAKQAQLDEARQGLSECELRAPVSGEVLRILTGPGDVLSSNAKQPAVIFCPEGPRFIRAEVTQEFASRIKKDQPALIQSDTDPSQVWRGRVQHISGWYSHRRSILFEPTQVNDVRTLECIIAVDSGQAPLRIGQRMRVSLGEPFPEEEHARQ